MRPDRLYLLDIEEAALAIGRFLEGIDEGAFLSDELIQSAVLQKLTVIGEAAARVSTEVKLQHSAVEWPIIVGLRNIVVHAYFAVSWETIWETAQRDVPRLLKDIREVISGLPHES